jgi:hypothetical protein
MTKRSKRPQQLADVFEQFGAAMAKRDGDIGRLLKFGDSGAVNLRIARWLDVLDAFEEDGDKSMLVALMKSGQPIPDAIVPHIGDLIDRWNIVRPNHRMSIPSWRVTGNDLAMNAADCEVDDLVRLGMGVSEAIAKVAAAHDGLKASVLHEHRAKRRSPDRRIKARVHDAKRRAQKIK